MKHAMKFNNDTKKNRYEAMKAAFRDMYEYYHTQDKPLITASVRQLNEYFRNLECLQNNSYFCKPNPSHLPALNAGVGRPLGDFKNAFKMNVYSIYKRREVAPAGSFRHIEDTIYALVAANSEEEAITSFLKEWADKNIHAINPTKAKKEYIEEQRKILVAFKCNTLECNTNNPKFLFYLDGRCDKLIQDDGLNSLTYYTKRTGDYVYNGAPITGGRNWC